MFPYAYNAPEFESPLETAAVAEETSEETDNEEVENGDSTSAVSSYKKEHMLHEIAQSSLHWNFANFSRSFVYVRTPVAMTRYNRQEHGDSH